MLSGKSPIHPSERRFYCALLKEGGRTRYLAYTRTAQGSRGAPLSWAVLFGLVCRCCYSTLLSAETRQSQRMQVYVDDPVLVVRGSRRGRREQVALLMLAWSVLGIGLAVRKGQLGPRVDWIGFTFTIRPRAVIAAILASRLQEVRQLTEEIARANVVSIKVLRTYVGKVQSLASLLYIWSGGGPCIPSSPPLYALIFPSCAQPGQ